MNKEQLIEKVDALAAELGSTVVTEGKTNVELAEQILDLEKGVAIKNAGASAVPAPVAVKTPVAVERPAYYMIDGKSLTTLQGVKANGDEITAESFAGGQKAVDEWVEQGFVAKG